MLAAMSMALIQVTPNAPVPVVKDAPPSLLFAGYDQCLRREADRLLTDSIKPEEMFLRSQAECGVWLDAYFIKLTSNIVITNIDYAREKDKLVAKMRDATITYVRETRTSAAETPAASAPAEK